MFAPTIPESTSAAVPTERAPVLTPRGSAVLAILRAQELVRALDAADREYLAPYVAELLVDLCADAPPA